MSVRASARAAQIRASTATSPAPSALGNPAAGGDSASQGAGPAHVLSFDFTAEDPKPPLLKRASGETIKDAIIRWLNEEL